MMLALGLVDTGLHEIGTGLEIEILGELLNLENAVEREKDVQAIDLDSVMKKCVVTLLVISTFSYS